MKIFDNIIDTVGNTPLVRLDRIFGKNYCNVVAKLESFNPCGSVKDRIGKNMIEDAEKKGKLKPGGVVVEATSGNTGIGLAFVCAVKGYKLILTMPDTMSSERRGLLAAFGAEIELTPGVSGMKGAVERAKKICKSIPGSFMPNQFTNPANPDIHRKTTAEEIWNDTDGKIDIFVSGVGTGGTITGVTTALKAKNRKLYSVAVEPDASAVLSGGKPGPHKIQGIGAGFIPEVMNMENIDEVVKVSNNDAINSTRKLACTEGILCGFSSGAALYAAGKLAARKENIGKLLVVLLPDLGDRYLSTELFRDFL